MSLFYKLPQNLARAFVGKSLFWSAAAVAVSLAIVYSGFDWIWWSALRDTALYRITWPAVFLGMLVPIFGTLAYLAYGYARRNAAHIRNAWAIGQAALLGYIVSTILKAFTGRVPPPHAFAQGLADTSHGFQLGFLQGGVFWGWPSSHTTVAFAMAAALIALYPGRRVVFWPALIYALYIGLGVSMSIHWFSEFAAGALIGWSVGKAVGSGFRSARL